MIYFKKLRWKNFLSTGNVLTEISLNSHSNTLIVGENGAGKSTILDAICYALYNKPFRNINKPQLINSINQKSALVEIEFSIGKNDYLIRRGMKPAVFEVHLNDNLMNQDAAARDYQEFLETQILKLNYKSFCQVVILGSASFVPFMQLPMGQRREIIEDLLDLQIFSKMNALLKDKTSTINTSITDTRYAIDLTMEKLSLHEEHMKKINFNINKQIDDNRIKISEAEEQLKYWNGQQADAMKKIEQLREEIRDKDRVKSKLSKLETFRVKLDEKITKLNRDIKFFHDHENCPTCKQDIDHDFRNHAIEDRSRKIEETQDGTTKLSEELDNVYKQIEHIDQINKEITNLNGDCIGYQAHVSNLNSHITELTKQNNELNVEKNDSTNVDTTKELKKHLRDLEKRKESELNTLELYKAASLILKDTGIKAQIINQYIPIINKLINKYLAALDFFVNFELDKNFQETIKSRHRDEFSYASFSEGEKMRINLAVLFTWRAVAKLRNSTSTNLLIMDEIFDGSLDSTGTDEFLKILEQLTNDTNTFIISHKTDALLDKFESILKFEKHHNFSRLAA
jgi:DNA repair exonuclease SbcCD ATPase subunit